MATNNSRTSLVSRLLAFSITLSMAGPAIISPGPAAAYAGNNQQAALLNNAGVQALTAKNFQLAIQKFEEALKIDPTYKFAIDNLSIAYNNYALTLPPQEALRYFHKAFALSPSNPTTQANLDIAVQAVGKKPNSFKDRIELAKQSRLSGDFDGAIAEYICALRLQNDGKTHLDLGNVYRVRDKVDEAINEYKAALSAGGLDRASMAEVNKNLGESYQQKKDVKSAIAAYAQAIKADPTNRDIIDALIAGWEEAINENPKSADNHIGLGQAYQLKGDFGQAKAEYEQALVWDRANGLARNLLSKLPDEQRKFEITKHINAGVDLQLHHQYDQAMTEYLEAIKGDRGNADVWVNLGSCLQQKAADQTTGNPEDNYARAIKAYQQALSIKPGNDDAKKGIQVCEEALAAKQMQDLTKQAADLYKQGRYQESLNAYRQVAQKTPNDAGVHFNMGAALQNLKDIDGAIAEYRQATNLDKKNEEYAKYLETALGIKAQPIIDKAVAAHKAKDYTTAIDLYQQAIGLVPKRTELHYDLASAYYSRQQYEQARSEYQKALEQDRKGQINDLYFLATIDEHNSKGYDAMDKYRKYLAESPNGAFAKAAQERLAALTKNPNDTQKIKSEDELARIKDANDAYQAAVKLQQDKQYDQAAALYQKAIQLQPKESAYPYALATDLVQKGDVDAGLTYFDQAIALDPKNKDYKKYKEQALGEKADQLVNKAVEKQKAEDFQGAIALYQQAAKLAPKTARVYSDLASAQYATDDFNGAYNSYKKALELDPKGESINWYSLGAIDENYGRGQQAIDEYRKFITYNPTDKLSDAAKDRIQTLTKNVADTRKLPTHNEAKAIAAALEVSDKATKAQEAKNYDEAINLFQRAMQLNPKEGAYPFSIGACYQAKGDLASASKYYDMAAQLDPKNAEYKKYQSGVKVAEAGPLVDQAAQKFQAQDFTGAIDLYRQALQMVPKDPAVHLDLASALQATDDFSNALKEYKQAYELDPKGQAEALYFIGALEENFGNGSEALKDYRDYTTKNPKGKFLDFARTRMAALAKNPSDVQKQQTRAERAQAQELGGEFDEAIKLQQSGKYDDADAKYADLMARSKDPAYIYARGTNYQAKGDIPNAMDMYKRAVAADPKNKDYSRALSAITEGQASVLMDQGVKQYNAKDMAGSIESFKQALALAPKNAKLHTYMAASMQGMDNFAGAREEYQKGFDLDNKGEVDDLYFMGVLDETLGKGKAALADYTKYLQYAPNGPYKQQANDRYQVLYFNPNKVQKLQTSAEIAQAQAANQDFNDAVQLQQAGKVDEAIAKYKDALKVNDADSIHYSLGTAYQAKGDYDNAKIEYEQAIKLNPKEASYKKVLSDLKAGMAAPIVAEAIAKQTGKDDKGADVPVDLPGAITLYEKALRLSDDPGTHYSLGTAYQANKDFNKAAVEYLKAISGDPKNADVHYFLGTVYEALNKSKEASLEYRKYMQMQPAGQYIADVKERLKILK